MIMISVWLALVFLPSSYAGDCNPRCAWTAWDPWGSCSESCGGGYRHRHRELCCRTEHGKIISTDQCLTECGKDNSGFDEYGACNTKCHHGGTFHNYHYDVKNHLRDYGHCICSPKYGGTCCDIRTYLTNREYNAYSRSVDPARV